MGKIGDCDSEAGDSRADSEGDFWGNVASIKKLQLQVGDDVKLGHILSATY